MSTECAPTRSPSPTPGSRRRRRHGFTLPELLIAIAILGILVRIALPRFDRVRFESEAAQRQVRSVLMYAQRQAIQRQYDVVVSLDSANRRLRIAEDTNSDRVIDTSDRITWRPLPGNSSFATPSADLLGRTPAYVTGNNIRTVDGFPSIVFRRNGAASTDAAIYTTVRTWQPSDLRAVRIDQPTSRTTLSRLRGSAWVESGP